MESYFFKREGHKLMIKQHDHIDVISFSNFSQEDINFFFLICSLIREKGEGEIVLSFDEIREITKIDNIGVNEFREYLMRTIKKFIKLTGQLKNGHETIQFVLFPTFKRNTAEEVLKIKSNYEFFQVLNKLTENYTISELQEFISLQSMYSKHLFRLLNKERESGRLKISIGDFKKKLNIPTSYDAMKISQKIFPYVMKELPQYFKNLHLEKHKEGRNITHFEFTFTP